MEALWQEIEPLGLRAVSVNPGSFRTGIGARTKFSGKQIEAYSATSGPFREAMAQLSDDMFPGDPLRTADVILQSLKSDSTGRRVILGSDAHKIIAKKIESLRSENEAHEDLAQSTDFAT
jgi:NAD(P)-dependent dehydrogenase (short-subunit alcohol dehydrogenase family)